MISIVVPIYNTSKYLEKCLESIKVQSYKDIEIILIDDGSQDNSAEICKKYTDTDSRFKYYYKHNGGVSSARNWGLKQASGTWIMFVDSDDWISQRCCEVMLKQAILNDLDIVQCRRIDECDDGFYFQKVSQKVYLYITTFDDFIPTEEDFYGTCWGFLFKQSLVNSIQFDESIHFTEDALFSVLAMSKSSRLGLLNEYLYYYNLTDHASLSQKVYNDKKLGVIESRKRQLELFKGKAGERIMRARLADACFYLFEIGRLDKGFMNNHYRSISKVFRENFVFWNDFRGGSILRKLFRYSYYISMNFGYYISSKVH